MRAGQPLAEQIRQGVSEHWGPTHFGHHSGTRNAPLGVTTTPRSIALSPLLN